MATKEKIYAPTLYEAIFLTLIGAALLITAVVLSALKSYDVLNYNFFSTTAKNFVDTRLNFLNTPRWSTILTFVLWMICGILVYLAVWFVSIVFISYREDSLPLRGFLTPRGYKRDKEIFTVVARGLIRFLAILLSIIWFVVLLSTILPYLTIVFAGALSPFTFRSPPTLLVVSALLGAGLFVLLVCMRFIFLRKRLFASNITD